MECAVFVSYSSKDKVTADTIVASLEHNNIRCWYAPRDIKPSDDWASAISSAIEQSKFFLLIFSGNSNQSQRVLDELNLAVSQEIPILPFRIENLEPDGAMRLHLSSRHWLDAFDPSWESHLTKLIVTVSSSLDAALSDEDVELPSSVGRKQKATKLSRYLRMTAGIVVIIVTALIGGYGLKRTNIIPSTAENESKASTEQAALDDEGDIELCKIAFFSTRNEYPNLWVMQADGSNQTQISFNQYGEFMGSWTPHGSEFVFFSWRDGDNEIFIMNIDGTLIRQLTDSAFNDIQPRLSPDGRRIAFFSDREGAWQVFLMDLDGSNIQRLTADHGIYGEYEFTPNHLDWSPDGEKIAFISDQDGDPEIYVMDQNGNNIIQLTANDWKEIWPIWSPDGTEMLFSSDRYGDLEIFVMNADGTNVRQLTSNNGESFQADWSKDGRIAFRSDRTGDHEIWIMNADGTKQQQVTFSEGIDAAPIWSPLCN
jgi:Tol biopolymer transport system component